MICKSLTVPCDVWQRRDLAELLQEKVDRGIVVSGCTPFCMQAVFIYVQAVVTRSCGQTLGCWETKGSQGCHQKVIAPRGV
jgi:hypothetical protein